MMYVIQYMYKMFQIKYLLFSYDRKNTNLNKCLESSNEITSSDCDKIIESNKTKQKHMQKYMRKCIYDFVLSIAIIYDFAISSSFYNPNVIFVIY